jgi:hypothetical protein
MLMAKPSGVCGNPSNSGPGDNSQRMHQLSATDWFPQAIDSDGGRSRHTSDILDEYQSASREGVRPFAEAGDGRNRRIFAVGPHIAANQQGAEKIACHSGTARQGRARNPGTQAKPLFSLARVLGFRAREQMPAARNDNVHAFFSSLLVQCLSIAVTYRSQRPSRSMGEGLGGGDGAAAKASQRRTSDPSKPFFASKKCSCLFRCSRNQPNLRHSRVASGDLADITPTQPSP